MDNRPAIAPQIGKRAIMRNGEKTYIVKKYTPCVIFIFYDGLRSWTNNDETHKYDIVEICED